MAYGGTDDRTEGLLSEAAYQDEATARQIDQIQKDIADSSELVGDIEAIDCLSKEYSVDDNVYQAKIKDLSAKYKHLRRTRGDGNCFFRAFAFSYLERLLYNKTELESFRQAVEKNQTQLLSLGYPSFTLEDFHDTFVDILDSVVKPDGTIDELVKTFRDSGMSDYVVCYLRIVTSGYIQSNADFYMAFLEGYQSIKDYCNHEVDPMYRESDHIHISALTQALGVNVRVLYMDRGEGAGVNHHDFPEGATPHIHILYRPGHYDILYS